MKTAILSILTLASFISLSLFGCKSAQVTSARIYLYQQNDLVNAKVQLQEALRVNPNDAEAHYLLGEVYSLEQQFPEMLKEYDASLAINQKFKAGIDQTKEKHYHHSYNSAVEKFNAQNYAAALADLNTALLIQPEAMESWSLKGKAHVSAKQLPEAEAALKKAISLDAQSENLTERSLLMQVCYNLATTYNDQANGEDDAAQKAVWRTQAAGKFQESLILAEEILTKDASHKDAVKIAAFCYNELAVAEDDPAQKMILQDKAIAYFSKVLEVQPDNSDMVFNLGILYEKMEKYDLAAAAYEKAFLMNPQDAEAVQHAAYLYLEKKKDYVKAIELYKKAVEINPTAANWTNLGVAQIQEGTATNNQNLIEDGKKSMEKAKALGGQNP